VRGQGDQDLGVFENQAHDRVRLVAVLAMDDARRRKAGLRL
jgi:hypothetical protein